MLDHCIVAILAGTGKAQSWDYRHPHFTPGAWSIHPVCRPIEDYTWETRYNGTPYGRHKSEKAAQRLMDFMTGARLAA